MEKKIEFSNKLKVKVPGESFGYTRSCSAVLEWELRKTDKGLEFSMSGHVTSPNGHGWLCGGQCVDIIASLLPSNKKIQRMKDIWERWHLNDLRAGCEHQRALGWGKEQISDMGKLSAWVYPHEHPKGVLCKSCPECGYKYGSSWLHEELPMEVVSEIKSW